MPVRVDIEGLLALLRERNFYSLPFVVAPPRGTSSAEIFSAVREAVVQSDRAARARVPDDPTWTTGVDPTPRGIAAELNDGPMTEEEIRSWFADFSSLLADLDLRLAVKPLPPDRRVPTFEDWLDLPPPLTAFLSFTVPEGLPDLSRRVSDDRLVEIIGAATEWTRVLRGTTAVGIGLTDVVTRPDLLVSMVAEQLPLSYQQVRVQQFTKAPKRLRFVNVSLFAQGSAQLVDESATLGEQYAALLELVRTVGRWTDYVAVRRSSSIVPRYAEDASHCLGREASEGEQATLRPAAWRLLGDHVVDAYVAQVLTDRHLARIDDLGHFEVEDLGDERFLVRARDPGPWLSGLNPDPDVWASARQAFAPAQLTREAVMTARQQP